jgi:hypothetical protein
MAYANFKQRWLGGRIDYDHVYAYQCVDLILIYAKEEFGLATGVWGNAIDYWRKPTAVLLTKFDLIATTECQQGDIVVLNGLAGNPYGHIGICDSQNASVVNILEQNGQTGNGSGAGGDAIRVRGVPKSRIAGILRPKAPPAAPAPPSSAGTVFLPSTVYTWAGYRVGSSLRKGTSDQICTLCPYQFPPGLTYKIVARVGDYAVVIDSQMFGRITIWTRGTEAQFK